MPKNRLAWLGLFVAVVAVIAVIVFSCSRPEIIKVDSVPSPTLPKTAPPLSKLLPKSGGVLGILLIGSDKRPGEPGERADAIMYILLSAKMRKMLILSFPRDAFLPIPGRGSNKINSSLAFGGPRLTVRTVRNYLGLPVDYYVTARFDEFRRVVNRLGGVRVTVDNRVRVGDIVVPAGTRVLTGAQALAFARARKDVPQGDFGRARNQQKIVAAAHRQYILSRPAADYAGYVSLMREEFTTDMPALVALSAAQTVRTIPAAKVTRIVLPGHDGRVGRASVIFLEQDKIRQIVAEARSDFRLR